MSGYYPPPQQKQGYPQAPMPGAMPGSAPGAMPYDPPTALLTHCSKPMPHCTAHRPPISAVSGSWPAVPLTSSRTVPNGLLPTAARPTTAGCVPCSGCL
ncbi:hypothetical protein MRX96_039134 [Rhipicephalus microplus]